MTPPLCPPCAAERLRWLDYTLPHPPIRLITIGNSVREMKDAQEARYRDWRDTVNFHMDLIARQCEQARHATARSVIPRVATVKVRGDLL